MSRIRKSQGYVLRTLNYGDTSRIVTALCEDVGKISFIAKGARRPESKLGSALDLLTLTEFVYYNSDGLKMLSQVSLVEAHLTIKYDYDKLDAALRCCRWLYRLLEEDHQEPAVYRLFHDYLKILESVDEHFDEYELALKLKILAGMGLAPALDRCGLCDQEPERGWFSMGLGGIVCENCHNSSNADERPIQIGTAKALQTMLRFPFEKLARLKYAPDMVRYGNKLMDEFISHHLKPHVQSRKRAT